MTKDCQGLHKELDLTGQLLIAMPGMGDPRFDHSVVYLCAHGADGAMGLIVNKTAGQVTLADLVSQLDIDPSDDPAVAQTQLMFGGPVEQGRGFVLHSSEYRSRVHSLEVGEGFAMTATLDVLEDIVQGRGPAQALVMLGYAGWGAGQLENEIARNGWLTSAAEPDLVFERPAKDKWSLALKALGVDPLSLSAAAGRA